MRIRELTDTQKYELLTVVLGGSPQGLAVEENPLMHLIADYMPSWIQFKKDINYSLGVQHPVGQRGLHCDLCNKLDGIVKGIDGITHRSHDYNDSDRENDFVCNCSYCQIVLHRECTCKLCVTNQYTDIDFTTYASKAKDLTEQIFGIAEKNIDYNELYMDGMITKAEWLKSITDIKQEFNI